MSRFRPLPRSFFRRPADEVAPELLGRYLVRRLGEDRLVLEIVETEAYLGVVDRASHAWNGRRTRRTATLFRDGGCAYVYLIYGLHCCLNAVTGTAVDGHAVLIRAGAPVQGAELMRRHRGRTRPLRPAELAGGPGKLCQALAIDLRLDGAPLYRGELVVARGEPVAVGAVASGPRIGVDYAGEAAAWPLRFAVAGHPEVSPPRP